ncbi:VanZ family protein [bacterium]|nr:VanZ family protein [bacterium]
MPQLPRNPKFWLGGFLLWLFVLWGLSSFSLAGTTAPPIDHFDKIAHFGYFFGGSGLLCAFLFRRRPNRQDWKILIATAVLVIAVVGALDEFHQSFTPGRSGNDPYDWLADVLGAIAGGIVFQRIHHLVK